MNLKKFGVGWFLVLVIFALAGAGVFLNRDKIAAFAATMQSRMNPTTLDDGLVGYWSFDGDMVTDKVYDSSGQGNHVFFSGGATSSAKTMGKFGQALNFDGSNDFVYTLDPASGVLDFADGEKFSLSGWFKWERTQLTDTVVAKKTVYSSAGQGYIVFANNGPLVFAVSDGTDQYQIDSSVSVNDSKWHHFTAVWGDTYANLYIDGVLENGTLTGTIGNVNSLANVFPIGIAVDSDGDDVFDGSIDDVRIYNRALSADEAFQLYKLGGGSEMNVDAGTNALEEGLAGYWKFDDASGSTTIDSSVNASRGTTTNMETGDWSTGRIGGALTFDGTNEYVVASTTFGTLSAFTTCAWIKPNFSDSDTNTQTLLTRQLTAGDTDRIKLTWNGVGNRWEIDSAAAFQYRLDSVTSVAPFSAGEWHHLCFGYNNARYTAEYYWDGRAVATTEGAWYDNANNTASMPFRIGSGVSAEYFNGAIDEVRVYDRLLKAAEVDALYRRTLPTEIDATLVGHWTFDAPDISGTTAYDRSGAGNNGTMSGASSPGPKAISGKIGQALDFDGGVTNGEGDYVDLGSPAVLDNVHTFTWSAWVRPGFFDLGNGPVIQKGNGSSEDKKFYFGVTTGGSPSTVNAIIDTSGTSAWSISADNTYVQDEWAHWTVTYDNAGDRKVRIYKNGQEITYQTQTAGTGTIVNDAADDFRIGGLPPTQFESINAAIDDVRMYNRILTQDEIYALYKLSGGITINSSQNDMQTDGLVGLWSFDGPDVTDKVYDRSGNGNNGYFVGGATSTAKAIGRVGQSLQFDGTDDYVNMGDQSSLDVAGPFTITAWIYPETFGGNLLGRIVDKWGTGTTGYVFFVKNDGTLTNGLTYVQNTNGGVDDWLNSNTNTITLNKWHFVTFTMNSSMVGAIYVNGVLSSGEESFSAFPAASTHNFVIGGRTTDNARNFDGKIDEVRVYNRALSADEIKHLYNSGR